MRMNADQIHDYEKFAQHVRNALPTVVREKKIVEAMKNNSGAGDAIIKKGLIWNSGPLINVKALVPQERDGKVYTPTGGYKLHSNTIDVSMADVGRFQTGQDMRTTVRGHVHLITVILLHELTHWAREQSGTNDSPDKEDGFEFEKEAYGGVIER
jgi:Metallopeptidase toxin 3